MLWIALAAAFVGGCGSSHAAGVTCASELRTLAPVTDKGSQRATGTVIAVDGGNASFDPTCLTDVPRGVVALTVRNTGLVLHNVEIASQHIDVDIARGRSVTVRVRVGSQPVVFVCRYHRSLGMVGVLIPRA
jgi:plastocyanin